jgi:hypothetical protein
LGGREAIRVWLTRHGIDCAKEIEDITDLKLPALVYIDDRGITFRPGMDLLKTVDSFVPWMRKTPNESAFN